MLRSFFVPHTTPRKPDSRLERPALRRFLPLLLLVIGLAACGSTASSGSAPSNSASYGQPAATPPSSSGTSGSHTLPNGTPVNAYLIRSLSVGLQVNRPLDAEHQITQDILAADPQAQAAGEEINQQSDGSYTVALTFAVSAQKYDAVKAYLNSFAATYTATFKGKLINEKETVQNVTAQYVDL